MEKHEFVLARNSLILRIRNTAGLVNSLAREFGNHSPVASKCLSTYSLEDIPFFEDDNTLLYAERLDRLGRHLKTLQRISMQWQEMRAAVVRRGDVGILL